MAKDNQGGPGPKRSRAMPADEGFLGRWSRRKAEAKLPAADAGLAVEETEPPAADADLPEESREQPIADAEQAAQPPEAVLELPDIDKMDAGSDYSVFMQAGVPPALKTKALRKLWRVKPELANLDGLIDYGEDLTGSFKVVDHLKTAYEVGKGFLRDEEKAPKDASPEADDAADEDKAIAEDEHQPAEIDHSVKPDVMQDEVAEAEASSGKTAKS